MRRSFASLLVLTSLTAACTQTLPPPAAPARVTPNVALSPSPPAANHGRLVIDAGPGRVNVERIDGRTTVRGRQGVHLSQLCVAPCAVDLAWGQHELLLISENGTHRDVVRLDVNAPLTVSRVALGKRDGSRVVPAIGGTMAVAGGLILAALIKGVVQGDTDGEEPVFLISVGLIGLGGAMWYKGRRIEQPSSVTTWRP